MATPLVWISAAELRFVLDVDDPLAPERDHGGDSHRLPEVHVSRAEDGEPVHHAHARAARLERDLAADGEVADVALGRSRPIPPLTPGDLDVLGRHPAHRRAARSTRGTSALFRCGPLVSFAPSGAAPWRAARVARALAKAIVSSSGDKLSATRSRSVARRTA